MVLQPTPDPGIARFGMDTTTLAGPLQAKLEAIAAAGFSQVMLKASDLSHHPDGWRAAARAVRASGLRPTGLQVLRDFEGLSGHLHPYKVGVAQTMLEMAAEVGAEVLLVCSSTSAHASADMEHWARDLRKLAIMAVPLGIRIAYEALSWGRYVREFTTAWDVVSRADCPNLGLGLDSYHIFATQTPLEWVDELDPQRIFLVQLSDFMWQEVRTPEERISTARTFRVFPGEGVHSEQLAQLVLRLHRLGYRGDYSFEVFNDDYQQLPPTYVAARGRRAAQWLAEDVLHVDAPWRSPWRWGARRTEHAHLMP